MWRAVSRFCVLAAVAVGIGPLAVVQAQSAIGAVYYHDQSGLPLRTVIPSQAVALASWRLGFPVRLPTSWPAGSSLRALWVMDQHAPRFAVIYYGGADGYITCQVHESLDGSRVVLSWAAPRPRTIAGGPGLLLQSNIGGTYPVSELVWRAHGVRYDLLGSVSTPLGLLLRMAASLS